MGSVSVAPMVACDSSFMIKSLFTFKLPGMDYEFHLNTTHVALLIVSVFILIVAIIARIKLNKVNSEDTLGMFMNIIELIVEMLQTMVEGLMGKNTSKFVNYLSTLFLFLITALFQPIWFLFPINLIGEFAVPLSLSLRLFGNIMSGTVLMGLIYDLLKPFTVAYPAVLHAYFDLFSGCIQAYVFCMLTMVYVNDKIADE